MLTLTLMRYDSPSHLMAHFNMFSAVMCCRASELFNYLYFLFIDTLIQSKDLHLGLYLFFLPQLFIYLLNKQSGVKHNFIKERFYKSSLWNDTV